MTRNNNSTSYHNLNAKVTEKERILKTAREKLQLMCKCKHMRVNFRPLGTNPKCQESMEQ
jgi:hypothetical protein